MINENYGSTNNNIFDNDNFDNFYFKNLTYSNGFGHFHNKNYFNNYYIKKHIKNKSIKNRNNSSRNEQSEIMSSEKVSHPPDLSQDYSKIQTIPIFNFKLPQSKGKEKNKIINDKPNIYINKNNHKILLYNNLSKRRKRNISNSSIDEINISLKKLSLNENRPKINSYKNSRNNNKNENNVINLKYQKSADSRINSFNLINKSKLKKLIFNKNKKKFNKLIIQNENQFSYINNNNNNNNENYKNKIIFLKKIIYNQKNNIKILREQNKILLEKIKKMQEENMGTLKVISSLKSEFSNKNINEINDNYINNYINSNHCKRNSYNTIPNDNSIINIKENIFNSKKIIYSLYDNKNILSYDFTSNEFKLIQIINEEFEKEFNKDINTLYCFNNINNKIYIIAGNNNDQLYIYKIKSNKIKKYSNLNNNHMYGSLIFFVNNNNENEKLICLSGKYNKKVEIYNDEDDYWNDKIIEEMPEERCNSCYLIINNNYIYGFYGYNYILKKYLNNIVYYNFNNNKWNKILNKSLNNNIKGIKNHFCYENKNDKYIYILGGDSNFNNIIIDLEKKSIVKIDLNKGIKNNKFLFYHNYAYYIKKKYFALFDNFFNIHIIDAFSNEKEIIQYK